MKIGFSSPHGDFSFSIAVVAAVCAAVAVFVPSRGFLFFYAAVIRFLSLCCLFSSPHGDFSFSILSHIPLINQGLFL